MGTTGWVSQRRPGATTFLSLHTSTPKLRLWAGGLSIPFFRQKESYKNWDTMLLRNAPDSSVCVEVEVEVNTPRQRKDIGQVLRTRCCCSLRSFGLAADLSHTFVCKKTHRDTHTHTSTLQQYSLSIYLLLTLFHSWAGFKLRTKVPNSFRSKLRLCCSSIRDWKQLSII